MVQSVFIYLKHNMINFYRFFLFSYIYIMRGKNDGATSEYPATDLHFIE